MNVDDRNVLAVSPRTMLFPVLHGSGDYAVEVRRLLLAEPFDCLAVPLPPSFQKPVEQGVERLPQISCVVQRESSARWPSSGEWTDSSDDNAGDRDAAGYVPIDPCQPVIAALRLAIQESIPRAFIDCETECFEPAGGSYPDPYALKRATPSQFAAAVLPAIPRPEGQLLQRCQWMAERLHELEARYQSVLCLCSLREWPWIRDAYQSRSPHGVADAVVDDPILCEVKPETLTFLLGELPMITGLYEQARRTLDDDENLSVDGIKELLLETRRRYQERHGSRARTITPHLFAVFLKYVRNLSLIDRRLTPDMYTLVAAAQQIAGDAFAVSLAESARDYPFVERPSSSEELAMGIGKARLPDGDVVAMKNRLPGQTVQWANCRLLPTPPPIDRRRWEMNWNPYHQCSWPPEDEAIERFVHHAKDVALSILGHDLAKTEKFTTSLRDGLDIRDTLRNWHTGDLYVKVLPPSRGGLDCVVMLFDSPADPRDYPYRVTWQAEEHDESTLALFATDYHQSLIGPGIGQAMYGGALFLFPPRPIRDVWRDRRLDYVDTLEERLIAAACVHAEDRHIALLSSAPPGIGWKRLARRYGKKLLHVPLSRFGAEMIQRLRTFHVLNGQQVRSYASHFIRRV